MSLSGGGSCHPDPTCLVYFNASATGTDPISYSWNGCCRAGNASSSACLIRSPEVHTCEVTATNADGSDSANGEAIGTNTRPDVRLAGECGGSYAANSTLTVNFPLSDDDSSGFSCAITGSTIAVVSINDCTSDANVKVEVKVKDCGGAKTCYDAPRLQVTDRWGATGTSGSCIINTTLS